MGSSISKLIYFIIFLAVLSAAILSIKAVKYIDDPYSTAIGTNPTYAPVDLPKIQHLESPHAILVLDVSGSMQTNDNDYMQTEAALRFYEIYNSLSQEILTENDSAQIAVILFSSIAQVVNWGIDSAPEKWLEVSADNKKIFNKAIINYLGSKDLHPRASDPRKGQDTDYLAAINALHTLIEEVKTPPSIIFMTDGEYQPHPYFSPVSFSLATDIDQKTKEVVQSFNNSPLNYVSGKQLDTSTIFNRNNFTFHNERIEVSKKRFTVDNLEKYRNELREQHTKLLNLKFQQQSRKDTQKKAPNWTTVFLSKQGDEKKKDYITTQIKSIFTHESSKFIPCENPEKMVGKFISVLVDWFQLSEIKMIANKNKFQVPSQTQAFAITLLTTEKTRQLKLLHNSKEYQLSGRGKIWSGVFSSRSETESFNGEWQIVSPESNFEFIGSLYIRPRYEWVMYIPKSITVNSSTEAIKVELYLYSLQENRPVDASKVYSRLPQQLSLRVDYPNGTQKNLNFTRVTTQDTEQPAAYQASLPLKISANMKGDITAEVDLTQMEQFGIHLIKNKIRKIVSLKPSIEITLLDHKNRPTSINLSGVPSGQRSLLNFIEGINERF